jgi:hypothetical protein
VPVNLLICDWGESLICDEKIRVIIRGHVSTVNFDVLSGPTIPYGDSIIVEVNIRHKARKRQFPAPIRIKPVGLPEGKGVTMIRASLGSAIIHTNANRKLPALFSHSFRTAVGELIRAAQDKNPKYRLQQVMKILKGKASRYRNRPVH